MDVPDNCDINTHTAQLLYGVICFQARNYNNRRKNNIHKTHTDSGHLTSWWISGTIKMFANRYLKYNLPDTLACPYIPNISDIVDSQINMCCVWDNVSDIEVDSQINMCCVCENVSDV